MSLESIIQYEITDPQHIKAIKLCLLWEKIMDAELPNYHKNRLGKGDPRKCLLFKHCLKLVRDTVGLIPDDQFKLYIFAQIFMLKNCTDGTVHALIEPNILHGDNAWKRWEIWKKRYDKEMFKRTATVETSDVTANQSNIAVEFRKTKKFLEEQLGANYSKEKLITVLKNKELVKWVSFQKISPYYLILSPLVNSVYKNLDDTFSFDIDLYNKSLSPELKADFKKIFENEF